jgi:glycosyltransferase involved in cell wall biosynthesis
MSNSNIKVFIEGEVLVLDHFSGIGHYTASLLKEVDSLLSEPEYSHIKIEIGLPKKLCNRIERFGYKNFTYRNMPFSPRIINALKRRKLLPPIDLLFGKKVYVFTHFTSWPTLTSPQIPIIYDLSFVNFPQYSAEKNQIFLEKQTKLAAHRAARIITISDNSRNEIADHYSFEISKIDKVIPVLDTAKFTPQSYQTIKQIRAKYSLFDDFVLFVGNIEPRKNLVSLLRAYDMMDPALQRNYALLLVGAKGWKDGEIYEQIHGMRDKGLKIIQPASYVEDEDIPALYSAASVFAYVSVYEGYGIPPVEAMACGTPVVSSDNSSLPEATDSAALMVDAYDVSGIKNALEEVLSNQSVAASLIEKGFARVKKLHARDSAVTFLESIEKAAKKDI